ncbi:hypothetical protein BJ138DRAFT_1019103 [Hygrophoropsis aurantiaca]|uniref:Uncharacterized protein n=1 Tax=Hygrophoropsis aurantiaca TaxID=72124 RepID=A0ACB7ZVU9_9AGAM|nr:hypothetical protein BJ138DRAFT_1019103 [Hygrophoropsis aurantiaca]
MQRDDFDQLPDEGVPDSGEEGDTSAVVDTSAHNPTGKNQYNCLPKDNEHVKEILREYHRRAITNRNTISKLLAAEHGITMSPATVARRNKLLDLKGSSATTRSLPTTVKRQLVLDQLEKDPLNRQGPRTVREGIATATGQILTRQYVTDEMRLHEPDGFGQREPTSKKIYRTQLVSLGPHHEWSGDGHDKLSVIGFPIWAIRDVWSGKWLGIWVVPNNRRKDAVAYLYLKLVHKYGGMPIQTTTDCGSETTEVYGFANALREYFSPHLDINELPAHRFMKSVKNITIERGWLQLRLKWGDNVKVFWEAGRGTYNEMDAHQYELVQWIWPKLIQQELDTLMDRFNNHTVRFDKNKKLPSGVSPNTAYALHTEYNGQYCLQSVDRQIVAQLMEEIGGEDLIRFVSVEYAAHAQAIYNSLGFTSLTLHNVWAVFSSMLPLM